MDQATIQSRINRGYSIAARYLGANFQQYRPTAALTPLASAIGTILADFDIDPNFSYRAPAKHGNPLYYGLFDATAVIPGDYLVGAKGTWFVAGMEPNKPPICVLCNRTLAVTRPIPPSPGERNYLGDQTRSETAILTGWPASVLDKGRGDYHGSHLPGDTREPWMEVLMPILAGTLIAEGDRIKDDLGRGYTVSDTEATALGWRMEIVETDV